MILNRSKSGIHASNLGTVLFSAKKLIENSTQNEGISLVKLDQVAKGCHDTE